MNNVEKSKRSTLSYYLALLMIVSACGEQPIEERPITKPVSTALSINQNTFPVEVTSSSPSPDVSKNQQSKTPNPASTPSPEKVESTIAPQSVELTETSTISPEPVVYFGMIYYIVGGKEDAGIWRLNLENGYREHVYQKPIVGVELELSPNNKWFLYRELGGDIDNTLYALWLIDAATGEDTQLTGYFPLIGWNWWSDSKLYYVEFPEYTFDKIGLTPPDYGSNIRRFIYDPATGIRTEIADLNTSSRPTSEGQVCFAKASPVDYNMVANACARRGSEPFTYTLTVENIIDNSSLITVTTDSNGSPVWSPDGQQLLYRMGGYGEPKQLYSWDIQTKQSRQVTTNRTTELGFSKLTWSPDKQWAAFQQDGVCIVNLPDGQIICHKGYQFITPSKMVWSPDSRAIVIAGNNSESGSEIQDLYIISVPDGTSIRLTDDLNQYEELPIWIQ